MKELRKYKNLFFVDFQNSMIYLFYIKFIFFLLDGVIIFDYLKPAVRFSRYMWCADFVVHVILIKMTELVSKKENIQKKHGINFFLFVYTLLILLLTIFMFYTSLSYIKLIYFIYILGLATSIKINEMIYISIFAMFFGFLHLYLFLPSYLVSLMFSLQVITFFLITFVIRIAIYYYANRIVYIKRQPLRALDNMNPCFHELEKKAISIKNKFIYCQQNSMCKDMLENNSPESKGKDDVDDIIFSDKIKRKLNNQFSDLNLVKFKNSFDNGDIIYSSIEHVGLDTEMPPNDNKIISLHVDKKNNNKQELNSNNLIEINKKSRRIDDGDIKENFSIHGKGFTTKNHIYGNSIIESANHGNNNNDNNNNNNNNNNNKNNSNNKKVDFTITESKINNNDNDIYKNYTDSEQENIITEPNIKSFTPKSSTIIFNDKTEIKQKESLNRKQFENIYQKEILQKDFLLIFDDMIKMNIKHNLLMSGISNNNIAYVFFDRSGYVRKSKIIPSYVFDKHDLSNISLYLKNDTHLKMDRYYKIFSFLQNNHKVSSYDKNEITNLYYGLLKSTTFNILPEPVITNPIEKKKYSFNNKYNKSSILNTNQLTSFKRTRTTKYMFNNFAMTNSYDSDNGNNNNGDNNSDISENRKFGSIDNNSQFDDNNTNNKYNLNGISKNEKITTSVFYLIDSILEEEQNKNLVSNNNLDHEKIKSKKISYGFYYLPTTINKKNVANVKTNFKFDLNTIRSNKKKNEYTLNSSDYSSLDVSSDDNVVYVDDTSYNSVCTDSVDNMYDESITDRDNAISFDDDIPTKSKKNSCKKKKSRNDFVSNRNISKKKKTVSFKFNPSNQYIKSNEDNFCSNFKSKKKIYDSKNDGLSKHIFLNGPEDAILKEDISKMENDLSKLNESDGFSLSQQSINYNSDNNKNKNGNNKNFNDSCNNNQVYQRYISDSKSFIKQKTEDSDTTYVPDMFYEFNDNLSINYNEDVFTFRAPNAKCFKLRQLFSCSKVIRFFFKKLKSCDNKIKYITMDSYKYNEVINTATGRHSGYRNKLKYASKIKKFNEWYNIWVKDLLFDYYTKTGILILLLLILNILNIFLQTISFYFLLKKADLTNIIPIESNKTITKPIMNENYDINHMINFTNLCYYIALRIPMQLILNVLLVLPSIIIKKSKYLHLFNICSILNCLVNIIFGNIDIYYSLNPKIFYRSNVDKVLFYYNMLDIFYIGKICTSIFIIPFITNFSDMKTFILVCLSFMSYTIVGYDQIHVTSSKVHFILNTLIICIVIISILTFKYSKLLIQLRKLLFIKYVLPYYTYLTLIKESPVIKMEINKNRSLSHTNSDDS
ncbi:conserved protein, unknown function [Hepatocystis sp. ex Piliocolobus tephrosceles]|nr:conserved protein, unknown function [Hepatocystis sp. ex Piliocolobus tephrosceles]